MKTLFSSRLVQHTLFWVAVFMYFMITSNMIFFEDYWHAAKNTLALMIPQIIIAYVLLDVLIPRFLNERRYVLFTMLLLGSLCLVFVGYVLLRKHYFDVYYFHTYNYIAKEFAQLPVIQRLLDAEMFFSKIVKFLTPAALLYTYRLFKNQQNLLQLREQKRTAELSALKNQLNPHFLFNTLNNLYALALEGSEKTPEVIERLSEILDYMLYRCKENYVSLEQEIQLLNNYLSLEKIRYGKRVKIDFNTEIEGPSKIAPLILLTFVENACKHGVSQELGIAEVSITLKTTSETIDFTVRNTKPALPKRSRSKTSALGLVNIKKQLDLLYPNGYSLDVQEEETVYTTKLTLPIHGL
ncbi:MAG: histidine kinase [Bacteroidota bacterium]